jgi:hypothetical protein
MNKRHFNSIFLFVWLLKSERKESNFVCLFVFVYRVPRSRNLTGQLSARIEDLVIVVFLPIFFTLSGLRTQISLLDSCKRIKTKQSNFIFLFFIFYPLTFEYCFFCRGSLGLHFIDHCTHKFWQNFGLYNCCTIRWLFWLAWFNLFRNLNEHKGFELQINSTLSKSFWKFFGILLQNDVQCFHFI